MNMKALAKSTLALAVAALGSIGMTSMANASPLLEIQLLNGSPPTQAGQGEVSGDPGGTVYPYPGGPGPGAGLPSSIWPSSGNGFAQDPSFGNVLGTSGFHTVYLDLTEAAFVTFQYMGRGDAALPNEFWLNGSPMFIAGETNPCAVSPSGATAPSCIAGQNEFTVFLNAGLIPFQYRIDTSNVFLNNDGTGIGNPDPHDLTQNLPGYMLGVDPYLAAATFDTSGHVVYAGLSDLPASGDHDFQDLGVRISVVPEPGTLLLIGGGLMGLGAFRRRKA